MPGLSYSSLLLVIAAAASLLTLLYLMRSRWRSQPEGLQSLLENDPQARSDLYHHLVVPLMVYEERIPSFGRILKLVLSHFRLEDFVQEKGFREAMQFLAESISQSSETDKAAAAMCTIVRTFLSNPNVEYRCRPHLQQLLDQFLEEIEQ